MPPSVTNKVSFREGIIHYTVHLALQTRQPRVHVNERRLDILNQQENLGEQGFWQIGHVVFLLGSVPQVRGI